VTGLVVSVVRYALQYRRLPWTGGWIEFVASWFIHALAVFGVAGIVYVFWDSTLRPFFAKDKPHVEPAPGILGLYKMMNEALQKQRMNEMLALVCLTLLIATLVIGFFALIGWRGVRFSEEW